MHSIAELIDTLHQENLSCIICNGSEIRKFYRRGILDLYQLYNNDKEFLNNAIIADKVIGKGAAAILALGKVAQIYTDTISSPAMELLKQAQIETTAKCVVPNIQNRDKTGFCPLETKCAEENNLEKIFPLITEFVDQLKH